MANVITYNQILIALVRNKLFGTVLDQDIKTAFCSEGTAEKIYSLAKRQDLTHIVSLALSENSVLPGDELGEKFKLSVSRAVMRYEQQNYELSRIKEAFDEAGIDYIPLKGSVIRPFYPEPYLRTSSDLDILVREEQLESAVSLLCEKFGYDAGTRARHDISLFSKSRVHIELHFALMESLRHRADKYLERVWSSEFSQKKDGSPHEYEMSPEMYYFYHFVHIAQHFNNGGGGIRPYIDLVFMDKNMKPDFEKLERMFDSSGLLAFYKRCRELCGVWFGGDEKENEKKKQHTDITERMELYLVNGGLYGTQARMVAVRRASRSKTGYILSRLFIPFSALKAAYPALKKYPFLAPFYHIKRIVSMIADKRLKKSVREVTLMDPGEKNMEFVTGLVKDLGLV